MIKHLLLACALWCLTSAFVAHAEYRIDRVAISSSAILDFSNVTLNNLGQVAYSSALPNGSSSIFLWSQGQTTTCVQEGDLYAGVPISVPTRPSLNDAGEIAFSAVQYTGHQSGLMGVFRLDGTTLTKIAPLGSTGYYFSDYVDLNNNDVATFDSPAGSYNNISAGDGLTLNTICFGGSLNSILSYPRANDHGSTVVEAFNGANSIVAINGGTTSIIATTLSNYSNLGGGNINENGTIVFTGHLASDPAPSVFQYENGQVTKLVSVANSPFSNIQGTPGVNDSGQIAFYATINNGPSGIFTGADPTADKVVEVGDTLDGSIVSYAGFLGTLNDAGQIAFYAQFSNGQKGVYLATPVPEPSALTLAIVALIGLAARNQLFAERSADVAADGHLKSHFAVCRAALSKQATAW